MTCWIGSPLRGRVLLVTDRELILLGLHQRVIDGLTASGLAHCLYGEVTPNPTVAVVEGIAILTANPGPSQPIARWGRWCRVVSSWRPSTPRQAG